MAKESTLSFTLPLSCQICLGKVKRPVLCPNDHAFCGGCMDIWLERNKQCPACRVTIDEQAPYRPVRGGLSCSDEVEESTAELRRARFDLLYQEYEDELSKMKSQIGILHAENGILVSQLQGGDAGLPLYASSSSAMVTEAAHASQDASEHLTCISAKLDQATKLYEKVKREMNKFKMENNRMSLENENLKRANEKLRIEISSRSPHKFGRYTVATMQSRLDSYEKEVVQLNKALERSDQYIEELERRQQTCACKKISETPSVDDMRLKDRDIQIPSGSNFKHQHTAVTKSVSTTVNGDNVINCMARSHSATKASSASSSSSHGSYRLSQHKGMVDYRDQASSEKSCTIARVTSSSSITTDTAAVSSSVRLDNYSEEVVKGQKKSCMKKLFNSVNTDKQSMVQLCDMNDAKDAQMLGPCTTNNLTGKTKVSFCHDVAVENEISSSKTWNNKSTIDKEVALVAESTSFDLEMPSPLQASVHLSTNNKNLSNISHVLEPASDSRHGRDNPACVVNSTGTIASSHSSMSLGASATKHTGAYDDAGDDQVASSTSDDCDMSVTLKRDLDKMDVSLTPEMKDCFAILHEAEKKVRHRGPQVQNRAYDEPAVVHNNNPPEDEESGMRSAHSLENSDKPSSNMNTCSSSDSAADYVRPHHDNSKTVLSSMSRRYSSGYSLDGSRTVCGQVDSTKSEEGITGHSGQSEQGIIGCSGQYEQGITGRSGQSEQGITGRSGQYEQGITGRSGPSASIQTSTVPLPFVSSTEKTSFPICMTTGHRDPGMRIGRAASIAHPLHSMLLASSSNLAKPTDRPLSSAVVNRQVDHQLQNVPISQTAINYTKSHLESASTVTSSLLSNSKFQPSISFPSRPHSADHVQSSGYQRKTAAYGSSDSVLNPSYTHTTVHQDSTMVSQESLIPNYTSANMHPSASYIRPVNSWNDRILDKLSSHIPATGSAFSSHSNLYASVLQRNVLDKLNSQANRTPSSLGSDPYTMNSNTASLSSVLPDPFLQLLQPHNQSTNKHFGANLGGNHQSDRVNSGQNLAGHHTDQVSSGQHREYVSDLLNYQLMSVKNYDFTNNDPLLRTLRTTENVMPLAGIPTHTSASRTSSSVNRLVEPMNKNLTESTKYKLGGYGMSETSLERPSPVYTDPVKHDGKQSETWNQDSMEDIVDVSWDAPNFSKLPSLSDSMTLSESQNSILPEVKKRLFDSMTTDDSSLAFSPTKVTKIL